MSKESLFIEQYNKQNHIHSKEKLDLYDECSFSYLDILKEKEIEVLSKGITDCKCVSSVNFSTYYDKCDKCEGKGFLYLNGNKVICNRCTGKKRVIKSKCPLCQGEGVIEDSVKVKVKLNRDIKEGDVITLKGFGKESNGVKGNLYIKVKIEDYECFEIKGNDVYDRRMISFSKEEISKNVSKSVETVKGYVKVTSSGNEEKEVVKLNEEGINGGDFYVCLDNDLIAVKGNDVYKNVIINKEMLGFYIDRSELYSDKKSLTVYYYKRINDGKDYEYIKLDDVNNFKVVKLKKQGLDGKCGGDKGDLYLRVFFDDEFMTKDDELYHLPIKLSRYEVKDGKKVIEFTKNKITLNYKKNLDEIDVIEVSDYGFMINNKEFDSLKFIVNPYEYEVYRVSVKVKRHDKVIYLKNYRKYFYEEIESKNHGLKVIIGKQKEIELFDDEGNKLKVKIVR